GGGGEGGVAGEGRAARGGELPGLHGRQLVARQLGLVLEQEPPLAGLPVVGVVRHRAGVVGEADQPHPVVVVPAAARRVARVQRAARGQVGLRRRGQRQVVPPPLGAAYELETPGGR